MKKEGRPKGQGSPSECQPEDRMVQAMTHPLMRGALDRNGTTTEGKAMNRRQFLHLAGGAIALPSTSRIARAEAYPARPVRIIVGFAAGGAGDILARIIGRWLSERLGQPFIVENRPGAGSNIATEAVVRAQPDGYTLLLVTAANAINATFYDNLNFVFLRDIAPVASLVREPWVILLNPSVPAKTVPELIDYAKSNPAKINMASLGIGTGPDVAGELFQMMTGIKVLHVPYRGGALALTDLLGGQVQMYFGTVPTTIGYIKSGRLRALAVTASTRVGALPDIPTVGEFVPGYEASALFGIGVPRNTPAEIVSKLNTEINAALADPKMKARHAELGDTALPLSPADFGKIMGDETEKWGKVVKFAGIKPE